MPGLTIFYRMNSLVAIFIGGGIGSLARYGVSVLSKSMFKTEFPVGTLLANVLSCVAMGLILVLLKDKVGQNDIVKAMLITGFCGGFSTFSTFSFETVELLKSGNMSFAIANIVLSIVLCLGILIILTKKQII